MKRVKQSFVVERDGAPAIVQRGRTINDSHPLVARFPDYFEDVREDISDSAFSTETATANPGERRAVSPAIIENPVKEEQSEEDDGLPKEPIKEDDYSHAEVKALAVKAGVDPTGPKGDVVKRFNARYEE